MSSVVSAVKPYLNGVVMVILNFCQGLNSALMLNKEVTLGRKKAVVSDNSKTCLNPAHADRAAKSRGLCQSCYAAALSLIKKDETTWDDLIAAGKATEATQARSGSSAAWLRG